MIRWLDWFMRMEDRHTHLLRNIMSKLDELTAKVDELQVALDDEQAQIAASVASLEATIADLEAKLGAASPITDAAIQTVIDKLDAIKVDLQGTIPDAPPPVA